MKIFNSTALAVTTLEVEASGAVDVGNGFRAAVVPVGSEKYSRTLEHKTSIFNTNFGR
jgi:hypothetical protein